MPQTTILLVEDDANDALIAQKALRKAGVTNSIIHLHDGEEAIQYLSGDAPFEDRTKFPTPILILLDIKMPKFTGFDVLEWMQARPALASIPVIVLTGSIYVEDQHRAERLGAIGYEIKPVDHSELAAIASSIRERISA